VKRFVLTAAWLAVACGSPTEIGVDFAGVDLARVDLASVDLAASGAPCQHDTDCRTCATVSCTCVAVAVPTTMDCSGGTCFVDPCLNKTAYCEPSTGTCALR
jgi:hypothetical protein